MSLAAPDIAHKTRPDAAAVLALLKPVTWFPPMWAYLCGLISSGADLTQNWLPAMLGVLLAGPLVCGTSQAVNDWFDRHVDAINEPHRVIPSGRMPGRWGLYIGLIWSVLSLSISSLLGMWVVVATVFGLASAWAYSAPPVRLKLNGWWGNAIVGLCYEGLPWFTAAAAVTAALPSNSIIVAALLYSIGAHGIMTLNDFKAIEGDTKMGVRSLPVQLGAQTAARVACLVMAVPQAIVVAWLLTSHAPVYAAAVFGLLVLQLALMVRFLRDPVKYAIWYSALGVTLYVLGMMVTAFAILQGLA
jgi:chlorophyll/bacteriochlorophyll a synthase